MEGHYPVSRLWTIRFERCGQKWCILFFVHSSQWNFSIIKTGTNHIFSLAIVYKKLFAHFINLARSTRVVPDLKSWMLLWPGRPSANAVEWANILPFIWFLLKLAWPKCRSSYLYLHWRDVLWKCFQDFPEGQECLYKVDCARYRPEQIAAFLCVQEQ